MSIALLARYGTARSADGGGGGGPAGFPSILAASTGTGIPFATSFTVTFPSGSGGLFLIIARTSRASGSLTATTPSGWTRVQTANANVGGELYVYTKEVVGDEGASVTIDMSNTGNAAWVCYRVGNSAGVESAEDNTALSAEPPSLTPSWGSAKTLWLAVQSQRLSNFTYTPPADYTDFLRVNSEDDSGSTAHGSLAVARRFLEAASEDPGAFGFDGVASQQRAATIGIRPA